MAQQSDGIIPFSLLPSISVLGDSRYLPAEVDVDNLAIGVSEGTLSNLNLHHEHLIVGERLVVGENNVIQKSYGLIVDTHGVLINCTIPNRANPDTPNQYALQVEGSMYVSGSLHASNLLLDIAIKDDIMALAASAASNPWRFVSPNARSNAVFYDGNVTVGNESYASISPNPIFIVEAGDIDIRRSQFAIANTQLSKLNIGIIGNAAESPVVFHSAQAPIEFNVGRPHTYYTDRYKRLFTDYYTSNASYTAADVPIYPGDALSAPHLAIDAQGNVGVHIAETPTITYNRREKPSERYDAMLVEHRESMTFAVNGPMFASNIVIYDPDTNSARDINELYARVHGTFLPANQVLPGAFAIGDYEFPASLSIATPNEAPNGFGFAVGSNSHFRELVVMDKNLFASNIESQLLVNTGGVDFRSTLDVTGITNTYGDLIVHKGISVAEKMPNGDYSYKNVQFTFFNEELSNINYFGKGITTPGRMGVGISPYVLNDTPGNMLSIRNREFTPKIYEIEVMDLRDPNIRKVAFLGHTHTDSNTRAFDGSFVISTPDKFDTRYNITSTYTNPVQNIYLYPGHDVRDQSKPLIRTANPPVFGAFAPQQAWRLRSGANLNNIAPSDVYGRCGINTFDPSAELHVVGDIAFTQSLIRINPTTGAQSKLGLWERLDFEDTSASNLPQYTGIQYLDAAAAHVGINTLPSPKYGAVVAGKLKSLDGYFTADDKEIVSWIRPDDTESLTIPNAPTLYSQGPIGIGITNPTNVMEIKQRLNGPTMVSLVASDSDPRTGFRITGGTGFTSGTGESHTWHMQDNATTNSFELFALESTATTTLAATSKVQRAVQVVRNTLLGTYNTFINRTSNLDITQFPNLSQNAALTINGDLNVIGNVYATQKYHSSNITITSTEIQSDPNIADVASLSGADDVMIGGRYIHLLPIGGTVIVGANRTFMDNVYNEGLTSFRSIPMRVHNQSTESSQHPVAVSYSTNKTECYMEFKTSTNNRLWMGLDNDRFSVKTINYATGLEVKNFMTFADVQGIEGLGINETTPQALLHVSNSSSNQLRVTRKLSTSISGAVPSIQLETRTTSLPVVSRIWSLAGPDLGTNDKLCLMYNSNLPGETSPNGLGFELFTFSRNGGMGIGNTAPEYAIDIKNKESFGGIRLWNTDMEAKPQLVFQAGPCNVFGGDAQTDFRMLTYSNVFQFNAQTEGSGSIPILRVNAAGQVGFGTTPYADNDKIRINVHGGINIDDQLYVNGVPLFDSGKRDGFTFAATNIFVIPSAVAGGSFLVNSAPEAAAGSGNLFQIYVDALANHAVTEDGVSRAIVLDGRGDEVQLTFRTHDTSAPEMTAYMYRQWQYRRTFGLEFFDPAPIADMVQFGHEGWSNVVQWEPLLSPAIRNQFTMKNYGNIELMAPSPSLRLGENALTAAYIGMSNGHMFMEAGGAGKNVGIGTNVPQAFLHIRNTNAALGVPALYVEHTQEDASHLAVFGAIDNPDMVITADGRIGVGVGNTVASAVAADIAGVVATNRGSLAAPALAYRGDLGTGWWSPAAATTALSANGSETVRFDALRAVGMGTTAPLAHLHINTTNTSVAHTASLPAVEISYNYPAEVNTPIFNMYSSNALVFQATNNARIGFGTVPTTADFQVAKGFEFESEGQFDRNVLFKENILVIGDVRHRGVVTHDSDRRLKTDLQRIDGALDKVEKLTGYTYTVAATSKRSTGLIAQDVAQVLPEAVEENKDTDTLGVAYGNMMGLVVEALKELRAEVASIKAFVGM